LGGRIPNDEGADSREKLEADLEYLTNKWHDYDGNFMRVYSTVAYAQVKELLDRQAVITHNIDAWSIERLEKRIAELQAKQEDAEFERDYWREQVRLCLDSAYPPSHSPERSYDPNVMGYPDRHGCTTPSSLVGAVIDGLRDKLTDIARTSLALMAEMPREDEDA